MYNIIKRLANTNYYGDDFPEVVVENEVFNAFQQLYRSIGRQLAYQDEFYNKGNSHTSVTFEATYKSCHSTNILWNIHRNNWKRYSPQSLRR